MTTVHYMNGSRKLFIVVPLSIFPFYAKLQYAKLPLNPTHASKSDTLHHNLGDKLNMKSETPLVFTNF